MICIEDFEIEGYLEPGDFYDTTLFEQVDKSFDFEFFKRTVKQDPPATKFHP